MKENIEVSTKGFWHHLILALKGSNEDYTQIDMKKAIFFWLIQIPLAYLLAIHLDWGYLGVFWAIFFSESSVGVFTLWLFTKGKWKTYKV